MSQPTFLDELSQWLARTYPDQWDRITVVLPSKRACLFLLESLKKQAQHTGFAPNILPVNRFIEQLSGLYPLEPNALLFEFYQVYRQLPLPQEHDPLDVFMGWAQTVLSDFNDIDGYLVPASTFFEHLEEAKIIEHWSVDGEPPTDMVQQYLRFWNSLPLMYDALHQHLLGKKRGYTGLMYRVAAEQSAHFFEQQADTIFVFAGFNALNKAEEQIFQTALRTGRTHVFWDIDQCFLDDPIHDAGYFMRQYKSQWPYYQKHAFEGVHQAFQAPKTIHIYGAPKMMSQALWVRQWVYEQTQAGVDPHQMAVVIADENLLMPIVEQLPAEVGAVNITMGIPAKIHPLTQWVKLWLHMHAQARLRPKPTYYFREVIELLQHQAVSSQIKVTQAIQALTDNNVVFVDSKRLLHWLEPEHPMAQALFAPMGHTALQLAERLLALLDLLVSTSWMAPADTPLVKPFLGALIQAAQQCHGLVAQYMPDADPELLLRVLQPLLERAAVSFEGQPLEGLQLMGVLESRVLDFEHLLITNVNEDVLPAGQSAPTFIPYDLKRIYGLPTTKEKDAVFAYHFYRSIQRVSSIYLVYNTEKDGLASGEKSRFIRQLELEPLPQHQLVHKQAFPVLPKQAIQPICIAKTPLLMERLAQMADKGLSPTAITDYLRDPIAFYLNRVLRLKEVDEVEESLAANTLGTVMHSVLEDFYQPWIGQVLPVAAFDHIDAHLASRVPFHFEQEFREGDLSNGRNLLTVQVAIRALEQFLKAEKKEVENGTTIEIIALEHPLQGQLMVHGRPVQLIGNADRIERRNGVLRIIDYKTGAVEPGNLNLTQWDKLADPKAHKIVQLLMYALMYNQMGHRPPLETCIYSFKKQQLGYMPLYRDKSSMVDQVLLDEFETYLIGVLQPLFDPAVPFVSLDQEDETALTDSVAIG